MANLQAIQPSGSNRPARMRSHEAWFFAGFALAFAVFLAIAAVSVRGFNQFAESARWADQTHRIIGTLDELISALRDVETGHRGFLLTGDEAYLEPYSRETADIFSLLSSIELQSRDNLQQQAALHELRGLMVLKLEQLERNLGRKKTGSTYDPLELLPGLEMTDRIDLCTMRGGCDAELLQGLELTDRIHAQIQVTKAGQQRLLAQRAAEVETGSARNKLVIILGNFMALLLLLLASGLLLREIARRKRTEAERERFFTLSLDMLCIVGMDGYFKRLNPAFSETLGYTTEELQARPFLDFVHPDDHAATLAEMEKLGHGKLTLLFENRYRCKDGSWKWLSWRVQPFPAENLLYATARDVTESKQIERQLINSKESADAANRAKSTFLATMSHEIRTPMNGALGMLELLSLTKLDAEQRTTLEIVRRSGKSLLRIIDDILDFSKIEAGKLEIRPEAASIKEMMDGVCNLYSGSASSKGLLFKCSVDPQISPAVLVDPVRLQQILSNFVSNALKFTFQGEIEIKAELIERADGEERVRFSVKDTGIGISAENQQRLFEPFTQAEGDNTRRFGGTGLGLAISRRFAGLMGGSIEMVSELGKGTTMILTVSLPVANPKDPGTLNPAQMKLSALVASRRPAPDAAQAEKEGTLVLVVDDHPINRMLLARQVNMLGYAMTSAHDGVDALHQWQSGKFALIITDCHMPEMDGYDLARNIRKLESETGRPRIPIIACTANVLGGEAEKCFAAGMDDYLSKPVELAELLKTFDQWLPLPESKPSPPA